MWKMRISNSGVITLEAFLILDLELCQKPIKNFSANSFNSFCAELKTVGHLFGHLLERSYIFWNPAATSSVSRNFAALDFAMIVAALKLESAEPWVRSLFGSLEFHKATSVD